MPNPKWTFLVGCIVFTVTYYAWYPRNAAIIDECGYLNTAYTWSKSARYYEDAGIARSPMAVATPRGSASKYPPGNALTLLPFVAINWRLGFVRGWLLLLLGSVALYRVLQKQGVAGDWALLLLFHPSFVLYSRTLMSDVPAALLVLLGVCLAVRGRCWWSGAVMGAAVLFRYPAAVVCVALLAVLLLRRPRRDALAYSGAALVVIGALLAYHCWIFGYWAGPLPGYGADFSLAHFPRMFALHGGMLLLLYPLMLLLGWFAPQGERWYYVAPATALLAFTSCQSYIDPGNSIIEQLVRGQRLLLPAAALLLVPYAARLNGIRRLVRAKLAIFAALVASAVVLQVRHQAYLKTQDLRQRIFYGNVGDDRLVFADRPGYELINPFIGPRAYVPVDTAGVLERDPTPLRAFSDAVLVLVGDRPIDDGTERRLQEWYPCWDLVLARGGMRIWRISRSAGR